MNTGMLQQQPQEQSNTTPPPRVEITLSRPFYRLGGTVVGTVRVTPNTHNSTSPSPSLLLLRDSLESLQLTVAGYCRLDPRWHGREEVRQLRQRWNETHSSNNSNSDPLSLLPPLPSHTAPVWRAAGTPAELLELPERQAGSWRDARPQPIVLPPGYYKQQQQQPHGASGKSDGIKKSPTAAAAAAARAKLPLPSALQQNHESTAKEVQEQRLEDHQLAFSFRARLPTDAPHTLVATSCRYYYTVAVRLRMKHCDDNSSNNNSNNATTQWTEVPIAVYTANHTGSHADATENADDSCSVPPFQAAAHSSGLPTHVTAVELHGRLAGQWTVRQRALGFGRRHAMYRTTQTLRVADPATGRPVAIVTVVGAAPLHPGSRLHLKLDFPTPPPREDGGRIDSGNDNEQWVPCFQASACLQAEEVAIACSGNSSKNKKGKRRQRARRHLLATAHREMDPTTTESISLHLILPEAAPCSIATDCVEIAVQCLIDIAIVEATTTTTTTSSGNKTSGSQQQHYTGGYRNLRLEIPCHVTHAPADWEQKDPEAEEESPSKRLFERQVELLQKEARRGYGCDDDNDNDNNPLDPNNFHYKDIVDDLKILSLHMADQCGLRLRPEFLRHKNTL